MIYEPYDDGQKLRGVSSVLCVDPQLRTMRLESLPANTRAGDFAIAVHSREAILGQIKKQLAERK